MCFARPSDSAGGYPQTQKLPYKIMEYHPFRLLKCNCWGVWIGYVCVMSIAKAAEKFTWAKPDVIAHTTTKRYHGSGTGKVTFQMAFQSLS